MSITKDEAIIKDQGRIKNSNDRSKIIDSGSTKKKKKRESPNKQSD